MGTKKTITSLTDKSVNILTQQFTVGEDSKEVQIGSNHRRTYVNSESGRSLLMANETEEVVAEVMAVWGDESTVEVKIPELPERGQSLNERVTSIEESISSSKVNTTVWDDIATAILEGVNEI